MSRSADRARLYGILGDLERRVGGYRHLRAAQKSTGWPERGVYFFFERLDRNPGHSACRVVRVGTHGLRRFSKATLWTRLSQHRGTVAGGNPGGGNHRGSVFRQHVGKALLARHDYPDPIRASWGTGSTANRQTRNTEYPLELAVSRYIRNLPLLWVEIGDPPGPDSHREAIERNAIGLLSQRGNTEHIDPPPDWLGNLADSDAVRESGLWNSMHTSSGYESSFLDLLDRYVGAM